MTEILMQKLEDALHPVDDDGIEAMRQYPENTFVKIKFSVPRNIRQHRLFYAMINFLFEHQAEPRQYPTRESLVRALKMATGHVDEVLNPINGQIYFVPKSIAFGAMDNIEFREFFDSCVRIISSHIVPKIGKREVEQGLADILRLPGPDQMERG